MSALARMTIGVVVERSKAAGQWADFTWRPVSVLPGQPEAAPWTVLAQEGDRTTYYAGTTRSRCIRARRAIIAII